MHNQAVVHERSAESFFRAAEYDACLVALGDDPQSVLMRARCHLRTNDAHTILRPDFIADIQSIRGPDRAVALMLLSTAQHRMGQTDSAATLLDQAASIASEMASTDTLDEIAFYRAFHLWSSGDIDAAERALQPALKARSEVIQSQAVALLAWILVSRGDHTGHVACLKHAWDAMDSQVDVFVQARIVQGLTIAAREIPAANDFSVTDAVVAVAWTPHVALEQCLSYRNLGWRSAALGDTYHAYQWFRRAEECAPSAPLRAHAILDRARLKIETLEPANALDNIEAAERLLDDVEWMRVQGDARTVLLTLAELLAPIDVDRAVHYLETYCERPVKFSPVLTFGAGDRRRVAHENVAAGVVYTYLKRTQEAYVCLSTAFRIWRDLRYQIRSALTALHLGKVDCTSTWDELPVLIVRDFHPRAWFRPMLRTQEAWLTDEIVTGLSDVKRQILKPLLQSKTTNEIAEITGKSPTYVRNLVSEIYRAFGVSKKAALISVCASRGLV